MLKRKQMYLVVALLTVSIVTFANLLVMYWLPFVFPLSSFSAMRIAFAAFAEKRYYLLAICALICILLFLTAISVRRRRHILPMMSLLYLVCDLVEVISLLIVGLGDGYWKMYITQTLTDILLIILLSGYYFGMRCSRKR